MFNGIFWYLYAAIWAYLLILLLRKIKIIYSNPICIILIAILVCVLVIGRYIVK